MRRVQPPAVFTERFVRATAQETFRNSLSVNAIVVALLGAPSTHLRFLALESFVVS